MDYCARGCTDRGRHESDCSCVGTEHEHTPSFHAHRPDEPHTRDCRGCIRCEGCARRLADLGLLCQPDIGRITRALRDADELVRWVRANIVPGTWRPGRDDVLREAPAPLNVVAVSDADDLAVTLAEWAIRYATDSGLAGPDLGDLAVRRRQTFRGALGPAIDHPARVVGVRPGSARERLGKLSGAGMSRSVGDVAGWMLVHLDGIAARDDAGLWHDEIVDTVATLNARWPRVDQPRKLPIPCPSCDRIMLRLHPPLLAPHYRDDGRVSAQDHTVICHNDTCGRTLTEADYLWRASELWQAHADARQPRRERASA